uniref:Chitin deacetylase 9-like protein n=1 Tax=Hirondellea gigas TaxID=1518452 RepID=A0A6A7FWX2_9CRUS
METGTQSLSLLLVLLAMTVTVVLTTKLQEDAPPCQPAKCTVPDCHCSSTDSPTGIPVKDLPHFVVLSFDDAVTITNFDFYLGIGDRKNPNGCKVQMSFFVSHENTDYTLVNELHRRGHEIAIHSVTHKSDVQNYWRNMSKEGWTAEVVDQIDMLNMYGKIPREDMQGWRTPFLEVGGNTMYDALQDAGIKYDCSWPTLHYTPWFVESDGTINGALWPYTLDFFSIQEQTVGTKPTQSFPGMWVAPMTDLQDNRGIECSMLDACQSDEDELETSADAVTQLLKRNFKAGLSKRSPFGIYVHHSWFVDYPVRTEGMKQFLDYMSAYPEVYIVSMRQLIAWMKDPVPLDQLKDHEAFQCPDKNPPTNCPSENHKNCPYTAPLPISQAEVYMKMCVGTCPTYYPYLNNVEGKDPYTK